MTRYQEDFLPGLREGWKIRESQVDGGSGSNSDNEAVVGTINGTNKIFTVANAPNPASSLILVLNGAIQTQGASFDYTVSGSTITYATAPDAGFSGLPHRAWYRY